MAGMEGMEGMAGMMGMSVEMFQNMPVDMRTRQLFQSLMGMMPGMMDMRLMSPFFTSRKGQFFWLFEGARVVTNGEFAGAIIGSFLFAALATIGVESAKKVVRTTMSRRGGASMVSALVGGVMHAFRLSLHYLAMLLIMTFNVWVFLAVVVGHGVGYGLYLFVGGVLANKHRHDDASAMGSAALSKAVDSSSGSDARHKGDCC